MNQGNMQRPAKLLFITCLATTSWATGIADAIAAEIEASTQVLARLDGPDLVMVAHWSRSPDAYVLRVVMDKPLKADEEPAWQPDLVTSAERAAQPAQGPQGPGTYTSFFMGNTSANLRSTDPAFGCRVLTLLDDRHAAGGQHPAARSTPTLHQPYPPRYKDHRIDAWLLMGDGTQILPTTYSCDWRRPESAPANPHSEVSYEFPLAGTDQAVAVAIRVEDRYFIQKLAPSPPAVPPAPATP